MTSGHASGCDRPDLVFLGIRRAGRYVTVVNAGLGRPHDAERYTRDFLKALDQRGLFDHVTVTQPTSKKVLAMYDQRWPKFESYCNRLGVTLVVLGDHE